MDKGISLCTFPVLPPTVGFSAKKGRSLQMRVASPQGYKAVHLVPSRRSVPSTSFGSRLQSLASHAAFRITSVQAVCR